MNQVNFRLTDDEKEVVKILAKEKGISVAEFAKKAVLKEILPIRINIAFKLLEEGKCGRKRAWQLSGLAYHEFMLEWAKLNAEEIIPDEMMDKNLEDTLKIDLNQYLKGISE